MKLNNLFTGAGRMDATVAARAILLGVKAATSSTSLDLLREVRLVLFNTKVFLAFKQEAMQMFPSAFNNKSVQTLTTITHPPLIQNHYMTTHCCVVTSLAGPVAELQHAQQPQPQQPHSSVTEGINQLAATSASQKSSFQILGCSKRNVDEAMAKLSRYYEGQCSTLTFTMEELSKLNSYDVKDMEELMESQHLFLVEKQDSQGNIVMVTGLKDGISQMDSLVKTSITRELKKELRAREEDDLYTRVTWCFRPHNGKWTKFPKKANCNLEKKEVVHGIVDAQGRTWNVDLQSMEAILRNSNQWARLKRLVNFSGRKHLARKYLVYDTLFSFTL